ncbi:MAG TPA: FeoA family protein [Phycisphaerae bacterium]|nr:FeoA family protein [Phycisphaerae bacterium]
MSADLMLLSMVQPGRKVRLVTVQAGRGLKARLAEMGLVPGVELEVINRNSAGPLIVVVKQSRIMLGRGMAHRIVVS